MENQDAVASICYTVTMEDLIAYNEFHMLRSESGKKARERSHILLTGVFSIVYFVLGLTLQLMFPTIVGVWFPFACAALGAIISYTIFKRTRKLSGMMRARVKGIYSRGENRSSICEHQLEITEQGITHRTPVNVSHYAWAGLERIESDANHTFLYIGAVNAFVIPHNNITEGDFGAVLRAIKQHYRPDALIEAK